MSPQLAYRLTLINQQLQYVREHLADSRRWPMETVRATTRHGADKNSTTWRVKNSATWRAVVERISSISGRGTASKSPRADEVFLPPATEETHATRGRMRYRKAPACWRTCMQRSQLESGYGGMSYPRRQAKHRHA